MGWGIGNVGNGAGLNFKLKRFSAESDLLSFLGRENDIGIVTDFDISEYYFSPAEPESMIDGGVWIQTVNSGKVSLNILKKNAIVLDLSSCKQLVGGDLVRRAAYVFQNSEWNQFGSTALYLYEYGDLHLDVTGGWATKGAAPKITYEETSLVIEFSSTVNSGGHAYLKNRIDVTDMNLLGFEGFSEHNKAELYVGDERIKIPSTDGTITLNVSGITGAQEIGIFSSKTSGSSAADEVTVRSMWLE